MKWWQSAFLLYYLFFLGFLLLLLPWTYLWMISIFSRWGIFGEVYKSLYFRACISGLGMITIVNAFENLFFIIKQRHKREEEIQE